MGIIPGLLAGGAAAALFLGRSEYEKDCLVTDTYEICSPKLTEGGRTLVFLTDLHDKEFGPGNRRLQETIRAAGPDAVLIGGDMMVAKGKGELETSLRLIKALAGEFPVYCGNGNHELRMKNKTEIYGNKYWEYREALEKMGVVHVSDGHVCLDRDLVMRFHLVSHLRIGDAVALQGRAAAADFRIADQMKHVLRIARDLIRHRVG